MDIPVTNDPSVPVDRETLIARLRELEETLNAIRTGAVDAVVVNSDKGPRIFTLQGADHPYRIMVEEMNEGAFTLDRHGMILYSNARFAELMQRPVRELLGTSIEQFISPADKVYMHGVFSRALETGAKREMVLVNGDGTPIPVILSMSPLLMDDGAAICAVATDLRDQKARRDAEAAEQRARDLVK